MRKSILTTTLYIILGLTIVGSGCTSFSNVPPSAATKPSATTRYIIGPRDTLKIFVWQHPDISTTVPVQPDGNITIPLVEDMPASGKTSSELARDLEQALDKYLKKPIVTVTVTEFIGTFREQIRVVGQATRPQAVSYRNNMTLLDIMIEVGGLTEFAAGNQAKIVRQVNKTPEEFNVRLGDLLKKGDMSVNLHMYPGDILIIPESWF
jgi:polysaccharide export outer membrane protein